MQSPEKQTVAEISFQEGEHVQLDCTLKKISDANYLYWYKQASRNAPVYVLYTLSGKDYRNPDFPTRFSSTVNKTSDDFQLRIGGALISDSAVYCCAKEPTLLPSYGGSVQKLQCVVQLRNREGAPLYTQANLQQHLYRFECTENIWEHS